MSRAIVRLDNGGLDAPKVDVDVLSVSAVNVSDGTNLHGGGAYRIAQASVLATLATSATTTVALAQFGLTAANVILGVTSRCLHGTLAGSPPAAVATYSVGNGGFPNRFVNGAALTAGVVAPARAVVPLPAADILLTPSLTPIDTNGKLLLTVFYGEVVAPAGN